MKIDVSLTEKSIQDAIDKLERYKDSLQDKCIAFVEELASNGIDVARANTGNFGHYITFSYEIKDTTDGCTAIVLATETGRIQSTWQTADGLKTVDVSPLLMAEYGSGRKLNHISMTQEAVKELFQGRHTHLTARVGIGETKAENYTIHTALHLQCRCITHLQKWKMTL